MEGCLAFRRGSAFVVGTLTGAECGALVRTSRYESSSVVRVVDPVRVLRGLRAASLVALLLLVIQYLTGLWTSVYAPIQFTASSSYPPLLAHYGAGYALGLVALIIVVLAALSHQRRLLAPALGLIVGVVLAAVFGMGFVRSAPNDPADSFLMGLFFLVAFGAAMNIAFSLMRSARGQVPTASGVVSV